MRPLLTDPIARCSATTWRASSLIGVLPTSRAEYRRPARPLSSNRRLVILRTPDDQTRHGFSERSGRPARPPPGRAGGGAGSNAGIAPRLRRDPASRARHRAAGALVLLGAAHPRQGLRAAAPGPAGRRPPPDPGADHQSAPGRGQGRAVPDPGLRRRPRHRPGPVRGRPAGQPAEPRARARLCRPALPDPGDGQDGGRPEGALLGRVRRLRHRRGGELRHPGLRRGEHAGSGRRKLQHPAVPGPALAEPRGAQDLHRGRPLSQRRAVRPRQRVRPLQSLREGERRHRGGHAAGGVGVSLPRRVARLRADSRARRPVRPHRPIRGDRPDRGRGHPAHQRQRRVQLEADREPEAVRPRLPDLLRAQPVQRLHVLPERPDAGRRDQPAGSALPGRLRHPVRGQVAARRDPGHDHRRIPVPHRHPARRPRQRDAASPDRARPGRAHRRAVLLAVSEIRHRPGGEGAPGHRRPRRRLQLPGHAAGQHRRGRSERPGDPGPPERQGQPGPGPVGGDGVVRQLRDRLSQQRRARGARGPEARRAPDRAGLRVRAAQPARAAGRAVRHLLVPGPGQRAGVRRGRRHHEGAGAEPPRRPGARREGAPARLAHLHRRLHLHPEGGVHADRGGRSPRPALDRPRGSHRAATLGARVELRDAVPRATGSRIPTGTRPPAATRSSTGPPAIATRASTRFSASRTSRTPSGGRPSSSSPRGSGESPPAGWTTSTSRRARPGRSWAASRSTSEAAARATAAPLPAPRRRRAGRRGSSARARCRRGRARRGTRRPPP